MMILSETSMKKNQPSLRRDFSERILKQISPFFGFDYHDSPKQVPFSKHISYTKSPKGITLISKQKIEKLPTTQLKTAQISKWGKLIKAKTKISQKLFNTYTQKCSFQNNPEETEEVKPLEQVIIFLEAYRPDFMAHHFVSACVKYLGRYLRKGEECMLCHLVLSICAFKEILTLLSNQQQFKQKYFTSIQSCLSEQVCVEQALIEDTVENILNHFWQFIILFPKNIQHCIITYLIKQKFNHRAIALFIRTIIISNHSNLQILNKPQFLSSNPSILINLQIFPPEILNSIQHAYYPFERGPTKKSLYPTSKIFRFSIQQ